MELITSSSSDVLKPNEVMTSLTTYLYIIWIITKSPVRIIIVVLLIIVLVKKLFGILMNLINGSY